MESNSEEDLLEIDRLTERFFSVFDNTNNRTPDLDDLNNIFIEEGVIINNSSGEPLIYDLDNFIQPRVELLSDGTLTDFREGEISHKTSIFRNVAQRFCLYEKSGKLNGESFKSEGVKTIQLIKVDSKWKISSLAWCDEE